MVPWLHPMSFSFITVLLVLFYFSQAITKNEKYLFIMNRLWENGPPDLNRHTTIVVILCFFVVVSRLFVVVLCDTIMTKVRFCSELLWMINSNDRFTHWSHTLLQVFVWWQEDSNCVEVNILFIKGEEGEREREDAWTDLMTAFPFGCSHITQQQTVNFKSVSRMCANVFVFEPAIIVGSC